MKKYQLVQFLICFLFLSCDGKNVEIFSPDVTTIAATEITDTQAQLNGTLVKLGSSSITSIGFEYSADPAALANGKGERIKLSVNANTVPLNLDYTLTDLASETEYYFRAYAAIPEVEDLGDVLTFTTE